MDKIEEIMGKVFEHYFMNKDGLWKERLEEVEDKGYWEASAIAQLIFSCDHEDGIEPRFSENLKAVSSFMQAQTDIIQAYKQLGVK